MLASKTKIVPIEVKSSGIGKHESITEFQKKYSKHVSKEILLSQKDIGNSEMLKLYPIYMLPFIIEDLWYTNKYECSNYKFKKSSIAAYALMREDAR